MLVGVLLVFGAGVVTILIQASIVRQSHQLQHLAVISARNVQFCYHSEGPWTNGSMRVVYFQGILASQTQLAKYTQRFLATTASGSHSMSAILALSCFDTITCSLVRSPTK